MKEKLKKLNKWLWIKRYNLLFVIGVLTGKATYFEIEIAEKLKHYNYGGVPVSVLVLSRKLAGGHCYDRAQGMSYAFEDCRQCYGYLTKYAKAAGTTAKQWDHSWIEVGDTVYDTTWGFKFDKKFYYKIMGVKEIRLQRTKAEMREFPFYTEQENATVEENIEAIDLVMPNILVVLEHELEDYKKNRNRYYVGLSELLISHCQELLDLPKVKALIQEREDYFERLRLRQSSKKQA